MKTQSRFFNEVIIKSWWVITIAITSLLICDVTSIKRRQEKEKLAKKEWELQTKIEKALSLQQNYKDQLHSLNDPKWIELVLKYRLGVIDEGEHKFTFSNKRLQESPHGIVLPAVDSR
jgi:hypothetical protein